MKTKVVVLDVSDVDRDSSCYGKYRIFIKNKSSAFVVSNYLTTILPHSRRHGYHDGLYLFADGGIKDEDIEIIKVILEGVKTIKLTLEMYSKREGQGFSGWLIHQNIDWED